MQSNVLVVSTDAFDSNCRNGEKQKNKQKTFLCVLDPAVVYKSSYPNRFSFAESKAFVSIFALCSVFEKNGRKEKKKERKIKR